MNKKLTGRLRLSLKLLDIKKQDVVLDIGSKGGWLEERVIGKCKSITGIDIDVPSVQKNKEKFGASNFLVVDITKGLPFKDDTFDKIAFFEVLEHIPSTKELFVLSEIHRVLKKEGLLVMSVPNNTFFTKYTDPAFWYLNHRHYDSNYLLTLLKKTGFYNFFVAFGGRFTESFLIPFFNIFWFFKMRIPFENYLKSVIDRDYSNFNGWYTIFIKCKKKGV